MTCPTCALTADPAAEAGSPVSEVAVCSGCGASVARTYDAVKDEWSSYRLATGRDTQALCADALSALRKARGAVTRRAQ